MTIYKYHLGQYTKQKINNTQYTHATVQPDMSQSKNCTALVAIQAQDGTYPMITIHCDTQYETSYFCQVIQPVPPPPPLQTSLLNTHDCDDGWFTVKGSSKCFSRVTWPTRKLSYNDAQGICSSHDASILTLEVRPLTFKNMIPAVKARILSSVAPYQRNAEHTPAHIVYEAFYGQTLSRQSPHSAIPEMVHLLTGNSGFSNYFTNVNDKCSIVTQDFFQAIKYNDQKYNRDTLGRVLDWGVRCQSCVASIGVNGVICEKTSHPYNMQCQDRYFKCDDGTCILLIYRCDYISDCFDKSDEAICNGNISSSWINSTLTLSCYNGVLCDHQEQIILPIHAICDGLYSNITLIQEKYACWEFELKTINLFTLPISYKSYNWSHKISSQQKNVHWPTFDHWSAFAFLKLCLKLRRTAGRWNQSMITKNILLTSDREKSTDVTTQCKIRVNVDYDSHILFDFGQLCQSVTCPGMFKCSDHYCIYLSSVCDGQYDCKWGDDELVCPLSSCPGLLKCRGEKRCVSREEICDKHVNCLYSMDDEMGCYTCPDGCQCAGYSISCNVNNTLGQIIGSNVNHVKALILNGVQNKLILNQINLSGIIYLNVSFCNIKNVDATDVPSKSFIVITDFSYNKLTNMYFFQNSILRKLIFLDISFNLITQIKHVFLDHLVFLGLKGNPLREIILQTFHHSAKSLVDIQYVFYQYNLMMQFPSAVFDKLEVKVTDWRICCILPKLTTCTSSGIKVTCFGLFNMKIEQIFMYCISSISCFVAMISITKHITVFWLSQKKLSSKKRYFTIVLLNQSGATLLSSLYVLGILVADIADVNNILWRKNNICLLLNIILHISLVANMVFKTSLLTFVSLQIIYPFKHQCLWFRWSAIYSIAVWLFVASTYSINVIDQLILHKDRYHFDYICSIAQCGIKGSIYPLLSTICLSDFLLISLSIYKMIEAYVSLMKSIHTNNSSSGRPHVLKNVMVVLKLSHPVTLEVPFRFSLLCLLAIQFLSTSHDDFCNYTFIYSLPIHVIYTSLFSVYLS